MSELIVIVWFVFSLICFFVRMKEKNQLYNNYTTIQQLEIKNTYNNNTTAQLKLNAIQIRW